MLIWNKFDLLIMTFITLISFTYRDKKEFIRMSVVFYLVNVFICGSTYFIIYFTGIEHMKVSFFNSLSEELIIFCTLDISIFS